MKDVQKYVEKLKIDVYHAVFCSVKRKAKKFLTKERAFSHKNMLVALTPDTLYVYQPDLFHLSSLREKGSLTGINAISTEYNSFFQSETIVFESDEMLYKIKGLKGQEVKDFIEALVNITHVHPQLATPPLTKASEPVVSHTATHVMPVFVPNLNPVDIPSQLKKLAELRDQGILTEQEFTDKKRELLSRM